MKPIELMKISNTSSGSNSENAAQPIYIRTPFTLEGPMGIGNSRVFTENLWSNTTTLANPTSQTYAANTTSATSAVSNPDKEKIQEESNTQKKVLLFSNASMIDASRDIRQATYLNITEEDALQKAKALCKARIAHLEILLKIYKNSSDEEFIEYRKSLYNIVVSQNLLADERKHCITGVSAYLDRYQKGLLFLEKGDIISALVYFHTFAIQSQHSINVSTDKLMAENHRLNHLQKRDEEPIFLNPIVKILGVKKKELASYLAIHFNFKSSKTKDNSDFTYNPEILYDETVKLFRECRDDIYNKMQTASNTNLVTFNKMVLDQKADTLTTLGTEIENAFKVLSNKSTPGKLEDILSSFSQLYHAKEKLMIEKDSLTAQLNSFLAIKLLTEAHQAKIISYHNIITNVKLHYQKWKAQLPSGFENLDKQLESFEHELQEKNNHTVVVYRSYNGTDFGEFGDLYFFANLILENIKNLFTQIDGFCMDILTIMGKIEIESKTREIEAAKEKETAKLLKKAAAQQKEEAALKEITEKCNKAREIQAQTTREYKERIEKERVLREAKKLEERERLKKEVALLKEQEALLHNNSLDKKLDKEELEKLLQTLNETLNKDQITLLNSIFEEPKPHRQIQFAQALNLIKALGGNIVSVDGSHNHIKMITLKGIIGYADMEDDDDTATVSAIAASGGNTAVDTVSGIVVRPHKPGHNTKKLSRYAVDQLCDTFKRAGFTAELVQNLNKNKLVI